MRRLFPWLLPLLALLAGAAAFFAASVERLGVPAPPQAAPAVSAPPRLRLMFAGDIMLSRTVGRKIEASGDWKYPFLNIASTTREADLAFANLETPVSGRGRKIGSIYSFRSDPRTLEGLKYAGFDAVSLANNHIWDYAADAFTDTLKYLREAGIASVGGGEDYAAAHRPAVLDTQGIKVAYLAYTNLLPKFFTSTSSVPASAAYADWTQVEKDIRAARAEADIVVVSYHWGDEYRVKHNAEQARIGRAAIDAGADLVIGAHPHVQQEIEHYTDATSTVYSIGLDDKLKINAATATSTAGRSGWIAYSLGNFVFDQFFQPEVMQSRILEVDTQGAKITGVKVIPVTIPRTSRPEVSGLPIELPF